MATVFKQCIPIITVSDTEKARRFYVDVLEFAKVDWERGRGAPRRH